MLRICLCPPYICGLQVTTIPPSPPTPIISHSQALQILCRPMSCTASSLWRGAERHGAARHGPLMTLPPPFPQTGTEQQERFKNGAPSSTGGRRLAVSSDSWIGEIAAGPTPRRLSRLRSSSAPLREGLVKVSGNKRDEAGVGIK